MTKYDENPIEQINRLHAELNGLALAAIDRAIRIGELLCKEKERIDHGEWLPWLGKNISFSPRTASNYMSLFRNREGLKSANVAYLTEAYRRLRTRTASDLRPSDDEGTARMSCLAATRLESKLSDTFDELFDHLALLADYDARRAKGEPALRELFGKHSEPILLLDKISALTRAKVPREAIGRAVVRLAFKLAMNRSDPGSGDEFFPDDPKLLLQSSPRGQE